jgi:hypothetical protein
MGVAFILTLKHMVEIFILDLYVKLNMGDVVAQLVKATG